MPQIRPLDSRLGLKSAPKPEPKVEAPAPVETAAPAQSAAADPGAQSAQNPTTESKGQGDATPEPLSPQFAALARKEKALVKQQLAFKEEQEAWKKAQAEKEKDLIPKSRLLSAPLEVLQELGVTYDQLVEMALAQGNPQSQVISKLEEKITQLESRLSEKDKSDQDQEAKAYEQAVDVIRQDVKALVERDSQFETIKATDSSEEVVELIKKVFEKENVILSVEEACKEIEEALVEKTAESVKTLSGLKKIQAKLQPKKDPELTPDTKQAPLQRQPTKTLSNAMGSSQRLNARERAILAFKGELPK